MITSPLWRGKRFAVLGLARSGMATVRALAASGAEVVAWDSDAEKRDALAEQVPHLRGGIVTFADVSEIDLLGFDALIVSPGVPINRHPVAARARSANVPILGDIELFAQARASLPPHKVVGITGTNGKSTTTALIHHILESAGIPARLCGNIGKPILGEEPLAPNENGVGVYVIELSSYQIDLTVSLDCDVAILLNITPDHLDRYAGFEAYAASKARLFAMQSPEHAAIIGIGDVVSGEIARSLSARGEHLTRIAPGTCMDQSRWPSLQGPHNAQNALAAIAACRALGLSETEIDRGLESFKGLPHRMELVRTRGGVAFVNDSKATNPESVAPALAAFPRIHWILGGHAKTDDLDACAPHFGHVARAYTIGEAGERFAALLKPHMPVEESCLLASAVTSAAAQAQSGDTVLLSPACASFDQFRDFEDRGDRFRAAVEALS
ncbi:MAG: UDP-N-acetylmuramoyl-L-alanine--D-glutamate ligase [Sphingomonas sp.]